MSTLAIAVNLLAADEDLEDLVGAAIYTITAPQNAGLPRIVVSVVSEGQDYVLNGSQPTYDARISIACHAATAIAVDAIGEAVKACLRSVIHRTVSTGAPLAVIGTATAWKEFGDFIDFTDDRTVYRRLMDYRIRWEAAE